MAEKYFTVNEVAKTLGCSRQHIYELIWANKLPYVEKEKVITQIMIKKEDLGKVEFTRKRRSQ